MTLRKKATELLEEEKQMVIDAYDTAKLSMVSSNADVAFRTSEQYFNETYEQ